MRNSRLNSRTLLESWNFYLPAAPREVRGARDFPFRRRFAHLVETREETLRAGLVAVRATEKLKL